ncbi:hypothetical protein [Chromobacterium sp. Panama]|uniref:hypothetical protein n=1 Tax=Chromobacterium sp. Panama TaxID=2161826 RepID=UPI0011B1DFE5|nr:hypothetical protein [Chromobacterium sp. Panama]
MTAKNACVAAADAGLMEKYFMRHTQYLFGLSGLALAAPGFASPGNLGRLVEIFIFIALEPVQSLASKSETRRKRAKKRNVQVVHEHFELVFNAVSPKRSRL